MSARGFSLVLSLLITLLMSGAVLVVLLEASLHWALTDATDGQLRALVLAENGVEYARTLLPHVELNALLSGPDGRPCEAAGPESRNPMPMSEARMTDFQPWEPECDDGIPAYSAGRLFPERDFGTGTGGFFLRFSNNAEEDAGQDADRTVVVRSLGVSRRNLPDPAFRGVRNHVALVEAIFRQERSFDLPASILLFATEGDFVFNGEQFQIDGGQRTAVLAVSPDPGLPACADAFREALSTGQQARVQGGGRVPSVEESTAAFREHPDFGRLFDARFWNHLQEHLPLFSDSPVADATPLLRYSPAGLDIEGSTTGFWVVRGECRIRSGSRFTGVLLHLGSGSLVVEEDAELAGALWMSNLDTSSDVLTPGRVSLTVSDRALIRFDAEAISRALSLIPPTQLSWRILFP